MTTKITPFLESESRETETDSGTFRKQILPLGEYNYKGRTLSFTKDNLQKMKESFDKKAMDQVPFQLADKDNSHTNDPERTAGEIESMELGEDGLYGNFKMNMRGVRELQNNPKLSVSASIKEDYERPDGEKFPVAIKHILGTLDPKVTGMSPWSQVQLSNEDEGSVLNFSAISYSDMEEQEMPNKVGEGLTEEEVGKLRSLLQENDQSLDDMLTTIANDETNSGESESVLEAKQLAEQNQKKTAELSAQVAKSEFDREADQLVRDGVPKSMIDLAAPVMSAPSEGGSVDLSNTDADPKDTIRKILHEAKGTVNLAGEEGHSSSTGGAEDPEFESFSKKFFDQMN